MEGDIGVHEHMMLLHALPFVDSVCLHLATLLADVPMGPGPRNCGMHRLLLVVCLILVEHWSVFIFQERLWGDEGVSAADLMSGRLWRVD